MTDETAQRDTLYVTKLTHVARRRAREEHERQLSVVRAEMEERRRNRYYPSFVTKEDALRRLKISPAHCNLLIERKIFPGAVERRGRMNWDIKHLETALSALNTVYFISVLEFIKIGYTSQLAARMRAFETIHPVPVVLLHAIAGNVALEQFLHAKFAAFLVPGKVEWFRSDPVLLAFIAELKGQ